MFADPEVDIVQSLQGGYGSAQTIPYLDFDVIAAQPEAVRRYSDITALHVAIRQRTGLATVYGYGLDGRRRQRDDRVHPRPPARACSAARRPAGYRATPTTRTCARSTAARSRAPLVGGCLWLLMQTMGTPWEVDLDGAIFFFEDCKAPPYYVDGILTQLRQAGKLDGVVGVVVGDMEGCDWGDKREAWDWARSRSLEDVLEEHLEPLGVPVLYKLPLGHGKHLAALPLGVRATLDADSRIATVDEPRSAMKAEEGRDDEEALAAAVFAVGAAAPSRARQRLETKSGGTFRLGTSSRIDSLNPYVAFNQDAYSAFEYIYPPSSSTTRTNQQVRPRLRDARGATSRTARRGRSRPSRREVVGRAAADRRRRRVDDQHRHQVPGSGAANAAGLIAHITRAKAPNPTTLVVHYAAPVGNVLGSSSSSRSCRSTSGASTRATRAPT